MSNKRLYLFPAALAYGLITKLRNAFFRVGILKEFNFEDVLVVGVGNLTVGGTGKTPMVEYLIRNLADDYRVVVLSRGYGRKSKGFHIVSPTDTSEYSGDEPVQMASKFKNINVVVQEDRRKGINNILYHFPYTQIIILDDSFQHRWVKPDINILLTDYYNLYFEDYLLPMGSLREHRYGSKRADFIVVTKCDKTISPITKRYVKDNIKPTNHQKLLTSYISYDELEHYEGSKFFEFDKKKHNTAICFSGIANNDLFSGKIKTLFADVEEIEFRDHHDYSVYEVANIVKKHHDKYGSKKVVVTTEKDLMRLKNEKFGALLKEVPLFYLPMKFEFHSTYGDELLKAIKSKLITKIKH